MTKAEAAKLVIELNRDCTCQRYYYFNMVLYNYVIWLVRPGIGLTMHIIGKEFINGEA